MEVINIFLAEKKHIFDCFRLVQTMSSFIYLNLYHIEEWLVMTPNVETYTIIRPSQREASTRGFVTVSVVVCLSSS